MVKNRTNKAVTKGYVRSAVRNMINSSTEQKYYSVTTGYTDTVAGSVSSLSNGLVVGDNINTRTGDKVRPVEYDLNLSLLSGVGSTNSLHRVILFQDMLNNGTIPTIAEVLDGAAYNSTYALEHRQQSRYKILYDKIHGVVGAADSAATHIQIKRKMKGAIYYNGATAVTASNGPGAIFLITLTDSVTVSTAEVRMYGTLAFYDA